MHDPETLGRELPTFTITDPFSEEIMKAEVLKNFKNPDMVLYDGTSDPCYHLSNFRSRMYLAGASDATRCKAFPTTLTTAQIRFEL
ncbi:hypothetical protein PIB30_011485 [Stylosanthes scabra]|uniref:Uncharacterized protein n=1 Tax=Stylosanthes scabra TaxID=79078 RepID=A0ABU6S5U8_9FABA|nr:hypothetical protein [Stylosanthes scabra]